MDFNDALAEAEYRAKVREWLTANTAKYKGLPDPANNAEFVARAKDWQKTKYEAGYTGLTWPKAMGGQGLGPMQSIIFSQEEGKTPAPTGLYSIGLGMCIPTVFTHGSAEVTQRYVPKALEGSEIWCQLFSEPAAGSDLAGIRTRAVKDGSDWIINGQKVWTTNAHLSDFGIIVCRTDPTVPKHKGLTMFIVDMRSAGVEARPLKQMSGGSDFNEVFFTDVRVPDAWRLGDEGNGWKVALTTLMHERLAVGGKPKGSPDYNMLIRLARSIETDMGPAIESTSVRNRIAEVYLNDEGIKLTQMRALSALSRGQMPGAEQSIAKVVVAKSMQDMAAFAMDMGESAGFLSDGAHPDLQRLQGAYMWAPGLRIAGGTDEILRNIIAERVLGLPGDLRPPKETPFNAEKPL